MLEQGSLVTAYTGENFCRSRPLPGTDGVGDDRHQLLKGCLIGADSAYSEHVNINICSIDYKTFRYLAVLSVDFE
jgi:hypothetical protein